MVNYIIDYYCDRCKEKISDEFNVKKYNNRDFCPHCFALIKDWEDINFRDQEENEWYRRSFSKRYAFALQPDSERWDFGNTSVCRDALEFVSIGCDYYNPVNVIPIPDELAELIISGKVIVSEEQLKDF